MGIHLTQSREERGSVFYSEIPQLMSMRSNYLSLHLSYLTLRTSSPWPYVLCPILLFSPYYENVPNVCPCVYTCSDCRFLLFAHLLKACYHCMHWHSTNIDCLLPCMVTKRRSAWVNECMCVCEKGINYKLKTNNDWNTSTMPWTQYTRF